MVNNTTPLTYTNNRGHTVQTLIRSLQGMAIYIENILAKAKHRPQNTEATLETFAVRKT